MFDQFKSFVYLRDYFSRALFRINFRKRSWINSRGGNAYQIAQRIVEPLKPHMNAVYGNETLVNQLSWIRVINNLILFGGCSEGNQVQVFEEGSRFFDALWHSIDHATQKIFIETYTLEADVAGLKTIEKLTRAAQRGCDVKLIVDGFGSSHLEKQHYADLQAAGAEVLVFNPPTMMQYMRSWTRNHRKLAVIDDVVGFCGGMNLSDKYAGKALTEEDLSKITDAEELYKLRRNNFRDSHSKIVGPAVNDLLITFMESYEEAAQQLLKFKPREWYKEGGLRKIWAKYKETRKIRKEKGILIHTQDKILAQHTGVRNVASTATIPTTTSDTTTTTTTIPSIPIAPILEQAPNNTSANISTHQEADDEEDDHEEGVFLQILASHPRRARKNLHLGIHMGISQARKYCYICNPYFFPPRTLSMAISKAIENGCEVHIITAGMSDVPAVRLGYLGVYGTFLKKGVKMYEYYGRTLHAKYLTVDGFFSSCGSYNMDRVSYFTNLEVGWLSLDRTIAQDMERHFEHDLKHSKEVTMEDWLKLPWYTRWAGKFLMLLMWLLGP